MSGNTRIISSSLVLILTCVTVLGCSRTKSENVTSNGVYAEMELVANEAGYTDVEVRLRVGGPLSLTELELSGSDRLLAHANGLTQVLNASGNLLDIRYKTRFNFIDADTSFRIEFDRSNGISAPNSVATLPQGFTLSAPDGPTYTRDQDITITWDPAFTPDAMSATYNTICRLDPGGYYSASKGFTVPDNGQFIVKASDLITSDPIFADADCEITFQFNRKRYGSIDNNFGEGGKFIARQRRSITVYTNNP
jgi:hypothetical protein